MKADTRDGLEGALQTAIAEVDSALVAGWLKPNGESAERNLRQLRDKLDGALRQVRDGTTPGDTSLMGITKWVADWVPDINAPLLQALDTVEVRLEQQGRR